MLAVNESTQPKTTPWESAPARRRARSSSSRSRLARLSNFPSVSLPPFPPWRRSSTACGGATAPAPTPTTATTTTTSTSTTATLTARSAPSRRAGGAGLRVCFVCLRARPPLANLGDFILTFSRRHRVQAAAAQGMAAHPHPEDRPPDALHHRPPLCAHRRPLDLGKRPRASAAVSLFPEHSS